MTDGKGSMTDGNKYQTDMVCTVLYFWFKPDLKRRTTHKFIPRFEPMTCGSRTENVMPLRCSY